MPKQIGIYIIRHIDSGRTYVGSSKDVGKRLSTHRRDLRKEKHSNTPLQNYWNKYGEKSFLFLYVMETDITALIEQENMYMEAVGILVDGKCSPITGFNINPAGKEGCVSLRKYGKDHWSFGKPGPVNGKIQSAESRKRMSISKTGMTSARKGQHKYTWNEMTYNRQYKLWKNKDPLVPLDWLPVRLKGKV